MVTPLKAQRGQAIIELALSLSVLCLLLLLASNLFLHFRNQNLALQKAHQDLNQNGENSSALWRPLRERSFEIASVQSRSPYLLVHKITKTQVLPPAVLLPFGFSPSTITLQYDALSHK